MKFQRTIFLAAALLIGAAARAEDKPAGVLDDFLGGHFKRLRVRP
jgi:hypothetical protein